MLREIRTAHEDRGVYMLACVHLWCCLGRVETNAVLAYLDAAWITCELHCLHLIVPC